MREHKGGRRQFPPGVPFPNGKSDYQLELTWLRDHPGPYALGENETHMCFTASDYEAAHALHQEMGCIVFENAAMGLYFIADHPDGPLVRNRSPPRRTRNPARHL